jgi:hypothetical protein
MSTTPRRHFLKLLCAGAVCAPVLPALAAEVDKLRADRVGWARLKTPSQWWNRHASGDPTLMNFFRDSTSLDIDPTWYVADVQNLGEMCQYPLLFSQGVGLIQDAASRGNVREFIRRGGFLLIDACCNRSVTPDDDEFLQQQTEFFASVLPEARVVALPAEHAIFRCYYEITGHHPPHTFQGNRFDAKKQLHGLYGIMMGPRMAGLITVSGLQCGWSPLDILPPPGHEVACMKMLVNIYIYAMMQGG